jgi:tetratricopeptide (TPR) repeat protein
LALGIGLAVAALTGVGTWLGWPRQETSRLMRRGIAAAARNDAVGAVALFDAVLAREPNHAQALLLRGQLARQAGDGEQAVRFWQRVPDHPAADGCKARYLAGAMEIERFHAREAERLLVRATELDPAYLPPRDLLVRLYVLQQRGGEIRRQLAAVRELRPWSLEELILNATAHEPAQTAAESLPQLEKFVAADPDDVFSRLARAKCRASEGRCDDAISSLRNELDRRPGATQISALLADLYLARDDLTAARSVLEAAPTAPPADISVLRSHGMYAAAVRDWERARLCLERAIRENPDDLASVYRLGLALEALGRHADAERQLARARRLEQFQSKMERLGRERKRPPLALEPLAVELGQSLLQMGRPADALPWLEQALIWAPQDADALRVKAEILKALPDAAKAAGERDQASGGTASSDPLLDFATRSLSPPSTTTGERPYPRAPVAPIVLRDCHQEAGVAFEYYSGASGAKYLLETLGGGIAVLDYDGDGWPDLYFTQGSRIPYDSTDHTHEDRLFRNLGDGTFVDVTRAAGLGDNRYSQGCVAGDIDNDGDPDLVIANWGENSLYLNNGDGTFVESAQAAGITGERWSSSLALADFDRDGNLDLYVVTYMLEPLKTCRTSDGRAGTCHPGNYSAELDVLYHNRGDGTFEDVSEAAGIAVPDGKGLGILVSDLDHDGWPDVYVANDGTPNFLFRNAGAAHSGGVHFTEQGMISGAAVSADGIAQGSMGIAAGDVNGDGLTDFYVTNFYFEGSALYLNQGAMTFVDAIRPAGLYEATRPMLGFGTQAADFDLDGRIDLFAVNGHIDDFRFRGEPWQMLPQLFWNRGAGRFADVGKTGGEFFESRSLGRGVARLDWDRDGKPDVVVSYLDRPAALLRNETRGAGHFLAVELHGVESNRDAIGARITLSANGLTQVYEICGGDGYFASNERRQTIGLAAATTVDWLEILWPSGRIERWRAVASDSLLRAVEGRGQIPIGDK